MASSSESKDDDKKNFEFSPISLSTVQPAPNVLFFAYVHDWDSLSNRWVMVFASVEICEKWWKALQAAKYETLKEHWTRPSAQMFCYRENYQNSPSVIWNHSEFYDFRPQVMIQRSPSGESTANLPMIPLQFQDGYALGQKYVHSIPSILPGSGGEAGEEKEEDAAKAAEDAQAYRQKLLDAGKPVTW